MSDEQGISPRQIVAGGVVIIAFVVTVICLALYEDRVDQAHEREMAKLGLCRDGWRNQFKPCQPPTPPVTEP